MSKTALWTLAQWNINTHLRRVAGVHRNLRESYTSVVCVFPQGIIYTRLTKISFRSPAHLFDGSFLASTVETMLES